MAHEIEIKIPDIGGANHVDVIELLVKPGDTVSKDSSLVTLESDKATMEIPSPEEGIVQSIHLKVGDKVSEGSALLTLLVGKEADASVPTNAVPAAVKEASLPTVSASESLLTSQPVDVVIVAEDSDSKMSTSTSTSTSTIISAGPAVRRLARVLGVNLHEVVGTGRKSRITKTNIEQYVKQKLTMTARNEGPVLSSAPVVDFSQFGSIEFKSLNKIKRLTGQNVHRAWMTIPHVTQFDEADITELEAFRQRENTQSPETKLTILAFVCKVVSAALQAFPLFNTSLDSTGEQLIYKQYINIGIAVETPNGLVVPVIKGVNELRVSEIAHAMGQLSHKARTKGLMPQEMSGGCFTISSLGGIGGTAFTPIVNSPEVAILGLSRSIMKPVYNGETFVPRLMLPLSLSYDHRVIDGAEGARFARYVAEALGDMRRILI